MNIRKTLFTAVLASSALVFLGQPEARALIYTPGDLLLGFRATGSGSTSDYVVNLGSLSQFTTTASFQLSITGIGTDLTNLFGGSGTDWTERSDVFWGLVAVESEGSNVLYASRQRSQADTSVPATAWTGRSNSSQIATANSINTYGDQAELANSTTISQGIAFNVLSENNPQGVIQTAGTANQSYNSFTYDTLDFGAWTTIEGNFGSGTANSVLDLFRIAPPNNSASTRIGSFSINDDGFLTFTGAAVPEPSTYLMFLGGISAVFIVLRRRRKLAAIEA